MYSTACEQAIVYFVWFWKWCLHTWILSLIDPNYFDIPAIIYFDIIAIIYSDIPAIIYFDIPDIIYFDIPAIPTGRTVAGII